MSQQPTPKIEGYLIKKRGNHHKSKYFGTDCMRWFKLQEVNVSLLAFAHKDKSLTPFIFRSGIRPVRAGILLLQVSQGSRAQGLDLRQRCVRNIRRGAQLYSRITRADDGYIRPVSRRSQQVAAGDGGELPTR